MSLKIDRVQLEIVIKNDKARTEMRALEEEAKQVRKEMRKLTEGTEEFVAKENRLKQITKRMDELYDQIGITGLSMKELTKRQRELNAIMRNMDPRTDEYKKLEKQYRAITQRQRELRTGAKGLGDSFKNLAGKFNHYFGVISTGAATIAGVAYSMKEFITGNAKLSDSLADVGKTTGLTDDEVKELYKDLKKLNTRSARSELLDLARIAGKLGITGKKDITEFVKAADKINVALSEDLGGDAEEAIRQVGKLTDIFKVKEEYGIEDAMLKVGSAINSLGAASTANEGYLVEFSKRVAGIAPPADISIDKVLGLAATLDQLGQTSEVSATVYAQVIPDMFKDTATYAEVAGMQMEDFNKLLSEDTNEAFIRVLEGLNGNNEGLSVMVQKLDKLGLDGKRSISVMNALANNTQLLREQQALSNAEFDKGTSLTEEFNRKNNNMAANLAKIQKALAGAFVNSAVVAGLGNLVNKTAEWLTLTSTARLSKRADDIMQANKAFEEEDRTLADLLFTYDQLSTKQNLTTDEQDKLNEAIREIGRIVPGAITQVDEYGNAIEISKEKLVEAREAQRLLNQEMNQKVIDKMVSSIKSHHLAVKNANSSIKARQELMSDEERMQLVINNSGKTRNEIIANNQKAIKEQNNEIKLHNEALAQTILKLRELGLTDQEITSQTGLSIDAITSLVDEYVKAVETKVEPAEKTIQEAIPETEKVITKSYKERLKALEDSYKKEQLLHKQNYISKDVYDAQMLKSEAKFLQDKLKLQQQFSEDSTDTEMQLADTFIKAADKTSAAIDKMFDAELAADLAAMEAEFTGVEASIKASTEKGEEALAHAKAMYEEAKKLKEEAEAARFETLSLSDQEAEEIAYYEEKYKQGLLAYEDYEVLKTAIHKDYNQKRLAAASSYFSTINQLATTGAELFSTLKQSELDDINFKVENGLLAEEKGEAQRKDIMKKYADKEFIAKAAQIVASTAVAIMQGYAQLGPIGGTIAAVLLAAVGGVQLNAANKERQRVKQLRSGKYDVIGAEDGRTYSAPLVDRFGTGIVTRPTLVAEEPEIVVDPYRTNQIMTLNPAIMNAIMNPDRYAVVPQRASGKYPDTARGESNVATGQSDPELKAILSLLAAKLDQPIKASVDYYGTGGIKEANNKDAEMDYRMKNG